MALLQSCRCQKFRLLCSLPAKYTYSGIRQKLLISHAYQKRALVSSAVFTSNTSSGIDHRFKINPLLNRQLQWISLTNSIEVRLRCQVNGYRRYFSTKNITDEKVKAVKDPAKTDNENKKIESEPKKSYFKKFKTIIDVFWIGCKALFKDVRMALRTRKKLGLHYHTTSYQNVTREEVRHMRQTKTDVVRTFPVALLFMVPFIGYLAPLIAYFYPKQLLSRQFWHEDQKKVFVLEEYEKRSQYYLPLVKEVGVTCKEINNDELLCFCYDVINGKHPGNEEILKFKDVFAQVDDLTIQNMPRYHLVKICKCWLIPTAWYLPRWFLMSTLRKRISRLHEDDRLIARDGIEMMSPECIQQAVHFRGLDESSLCDKINLHWLKQWIALSTQVSGDDVSFLAHCAVFKAANFEVLENRNGVTETKS